MTQIDATIQPGRAPVVSAVVGLAGLVCVALASWSAVGLGAMAPAYDAMRQVWPAYELPMRDSALAANLWGFAMVGWAAGALLVAAGVSSPLRKPVTLKLARWGGGLTLLSLAVAAWLVVDVTAAALHVDPEAAGLALDGTSVFFLRMRWMLPMAVAALAIVGGMIELTRARTAGIYDASRASTRGFGDQLFAPRRTRDGQFRRSWTSSTITHVMVFLVLPWLLDMFGCVDPYRVPKGEGDPVVLAVTVVERKKPRERRIIVDAESPIIFAQPELDDSMIEQEVNVESKAQYQTAQDVHAGRMGKGGGKTGGWPDGMEDGVIRFIRIEHNGSNWDDGMYDGGNHARADLNLLEYFHDLTGFRISRKPESHPAALLSRYPEGFAPPFVYLTGDGNLSFTETDLRNLRSYLLDGGMLFADCGSPAFDGAFQREMRRLFPDKRLVTIADDDPILRQPFSFPNGAPPLWHHGGYNAMGVKHQGRWVVFYHPGDMNDAWKTGHSGMSAQLAQESNELAVNVMYYAFTRYLALTRRYRQ